MTEKKDFPVVLILGLSGAGKSTALQVFEDLKFVTADGLPIKILPEMVRLFRSEALDDKQGLALGIEQIRPGMANEVLEMLGILSQDSLRPIVLFLSADPAIILRRYATTRRPHPLESQDIGLEQAMLKEADSLIQLRDVADILIDSSDFSVHDLRREIQHNWTNNNQVFRSLRVNLVTFGFKYGVPKDADMVFDLRFLPNPYFEPELRAMSGKDKLVADFVFKEKSSSEFKERLIDFMRFLLPLFDEEGRYRITIAIGCTGGKHRSVAMAEALNKALGEYDFIVTMEHKHIGLG